ncbi:MAG TPA: four helix bundle protein [Kiritimatiellia bacterium]|nr:four helix bundle protein [Kiritimatiellia bacterium]HMO98671.1 four helix bundle protein [Kiritimatiellia bacterium]HMP90835.1 four helix bundle protein [Kiritimatiellia bacterium]
MIIWRAGESILLNIAHASASWSIRERANFLAIANGSALECAACMDILSIKLLVDQIACRQGKEVLREIVNMLISLRNITVKRVHEPRTNYGAMPIKRYFGHESLLAYQVALELVGWIEQVETSSKCSQNALVKLDKATTAIILNIAEGNGRFSNADQIKFLQIASKSTTQSAALMDTAGFSEVELRKGRHFLHRISLLISGLIKSKKNTIAVY